MYLIYDCSPVSRPLSYKSGFSETRNWPRLVHISWIVLNNELKPIEDFDCIVVSENLPIDETVMKFCKIDEEDLKKKSTPLVDILEKFNESVAKCDYIITHNQSYNENILAAEFVRKGVDIALFRKERMDLMHEGTYFCKLPSKTGGYKWPSLEELYACCFHTAYSPANNARADVIAATRSFIKLMKTGNLDDYFEE